MLWMMVRKRLFGKKLIMLVLQMGIFCSPRKRCTSPLTMSPNVLLETQVGDEVLSPRQSLTSVPFALKSSRSQQAYQSVHADTAMAAMNAPMADTALFLIMLITLCRYCSLYGSIQFGSRH